MTCNNNNNASSAVFEENDGFFSVEGWNNEVGKDSFNIPA